MTAMESLLKKLEPTKLYNLEPQDRVYCELEAYAESLQPLYDMMLELERECFPQTACDYGLDEWCAACHIDRKALSDEVCRERILRRLGVSQNSYTYDGIMEHIRSYGLDGSFEVQNGGKSFVFTCTTPLTEKQQQQAFYIFKSIVPVEAYMTINWTTAEE